MARAVGTDNSAKRPGSQTSATDRASRDFRDDVPLGFESDERWDSAYRRSSSPEMEHVCGLGGNSQRRKVEVEQWLVGALQGQEWLAADEATRGSSFVKCRDCQKREKTVARSDWGGRI